MCGEYSQCVYHTGFASNHGVFAFPVYTVKALGCSAAVLSKAGPGFHALPRSKLLRFRFLDTTQRPDLVGTVFSALPRSKELRRPGAW